MNKKAIFIGLGVLAVAGIGYYMWKKKNETTTSKFSGACGCSSADGTNGEEYSCAVKCGNGCWYKSKCGLGAGKSLGCGSAPKE